MNAAFKVHRLNGVGMSKASALALAFDSLLSECIALGVEGRHLALVTTKLEEACFFAKKSIAEKAENQEVTP